LRDPLGNVVIPEMFVDIASVMETKHEALAAHRSQQEWLEATQGMNSYLKTMDELGLEVGRLSKVFDYAEGWWRHFHAGFCPPDVNPLHATLGELSRMNSFRTAM
jgi:LmbE family N-acetylglucosaminyl deacetylase